MLVLKLGGSLMHDPLLPDWLALCAEAGGGRLVLVPGGGAFADAARAAQAHWRVDDVSAHNMAVLGMAQFAHLLHGLEPRLQLADNATAIRAALHGGRVALWLPTELQRSHGDELTSWDVSADSLAAWLALQLGAQGLVLLKSCALPSGPGLRDWPALAADGIVDRRFPDFARACSGAGIRIELLTRDALAGLRALLSATDSATSTMAPAASPRA
ncbi:MAG TPA: protein kinase [Thauera sp.]|nr:protein kinase [Thauera sp.]